jgi:hypothetical protein
MFMARALAGGRRVPTPAGLAHGATATMPHAMTTTLFPSPPPAEERSADVLAIYGGGGGGPGREGLRTSEGLRTVKPGSPRVAQPRAAQLPAVDYSAAGARGELPALTMRKIGRPITTAPPLYG